MRLLLLSNTLTSHRKPQLNSAEAGGVYLPGLWHLWEDISMTTVEETSEVLVEVATVEICDGCSARAGVRVDLPFGTLWFCLHHYNKNSKALTDRGGIAKLLSTF